MNINVPEWAREHFWEEPPEGAEEFWAFRFKPPCRLGEELIFRFDGQPVARARVLRIETPGLSQCEATGKFRPRWKVFWSLDSFEDLRGIEPGRAH